MSEQNLNKKKIEQMNEQKCLNKFNSVTENKKPENQNQTHNVRKEGIGPINQKKQAKKFEKGKVLRMRQHCTFPFSEVRFILCPGKGVAGRKLSVPFSADYSFHLPYY